jgi:TonB family protein
VGQTWRECPECRATPRRDRITKLTAMHISQKICCFVMPLIASCSLLLAQEQPPRKNANAQPPVLIQKVEPEYTVKARRANISGKTLLIIVVDVDGVPKDIKVVSPLGGGLDLRAVEAVKLWRFKPGMRDGVPVAVKAQVEVMFRLCNDFDDCSAQGSKDIERLEGARTSYNLGVHQMVGDLAGGKDLKAAFASVTKAAEQQFPPAEVMLGRFYRDGLGTPKDDAKAVEWFDRAAGHGDPNGQFELGIMYRAGRGVEIDEAYGMKLLTKAAEQDHAEAEYELGSLAELGKGVPQDNAVAAKWYRKSAEQGVPAAQYRLAKFSWEGVGGKQDQVAALRWAILAERNGSEPGKMAAKEYRAAMTAKQVAEAERQVERFKARPMKEKKS